ncbi:hypothetical protein ATJ88_2877 [Isoptericola jiangsuensis]|uniref:Uncharacterized protein n=1 Tax=Isoptericola jiangsuensis TaxID=548579 RepID=A0A2A9F161_9MICO|nr:hypothetical protein [Isoptericola jiangsuensis]PFG44159.1 hypothetical protein ATJ88_2877 [Isoptericola jiangsuensis]
MNNNTDPAAPTTASAVPFTEHGEVRVDSARLLIVDPAYLPADLVERLTTPNAYGVSPALMLCTPSVDGWHDVWSDPEESAEHGMATLHITAPSVRLGEVFHLTDMHH